MVSCREEESYNVLSPAMDVGRQTGAKTKYFQMLVIGGIACFTLMAACIFLATDQSGNATMLEQKLANTQKLSDATTFDQLSGDLLGGLEKAMDNSVDNKVRSFMAAPSLAAVPVPHVSMGLHHLLPFDPHPFVTQTELERLLAEKRELQRKREAILRTLRIRREAAAAKAAKDAAELDQVRLERAVTEAKKRQLEQAQRAARAAAAKMREAAVAKKLAIHAAAVAAARQNELESMSASTASDAMKALAAEDGQEDAANAAQLQQDKSAVDSKLQGYLAQERELLRKIATVEKVAANGGEWPSEGLAKSSAMSAATEQLRQMTATRKRQSHHKSSGVESEVIDSIVKAIKGNKNKLAHDKIESRNLKQERIQLLKQEKELRSTDRRLTKELVQAELAHHKD